MRIYNWLGGLCLHKTAFSVPLRFPFVEVASLNTFNANPTIDHKVVPFSQPSCIPPSSARLTQISFQLLLEPVWLFSYLLLSMKA